MLRRNRVHVAGGVEVALSVVEWPVGGAFFGVCAVPGVAEVLCAAVDAAQRGFDSGARTCLLPGCLRRSPRASRRLRGGCCRLQL